MENKWISVDERLPEEDTVFLTWREDYTDGDAAVLYHRSNVGFVVFNTQCPDVYLKAGDKFTHWMPLPLPPQP